MTNIVLLVGNLGADPQTRTTNSGGDVTTFNLGTRPPKRDSEGKTFKDASGFTAKDTEWHRVTCFNSLGRTIARHASKGMLVSVSRRIHNSKWTDSDGIERYGYEIIADDVQFLNRPEKPASSMAYINLGIFWTNHHHMLATADAPSGPTCSSSSG